MEETTFTTPTDLELEVTRTFDVPRELVFDVWTTCEHLPAWSGPEGWSLAACELDLRPGGTFRYVWRSPQGYDAPSEGTYLEVERPSRLVTSVGYDGVNRTTQTLELTEESGGGTRMSYRVAYPSTAIRDGAIAPEMQQGMAAGYDRLAALLATLA